MKRRETTYAVNKSAASPGNKEARGVEATHHRTADLVLRRRG